MFNSSITRILMPMKRQTDIGVRIVTRRITCMCKSLKAFKYATPSKLQGMKISTARNQILSNKFCKLAEEILEPLNYYIS